MRTEEDTTGIWPGICERELGQSRSAKAGHLLSAQLQLANDLASYDCIIGLGQYPRLAKNSSLPARAGPGLGVFRGVKMPAATAPEDDEHQELKGFIGAAAESR
jgi:hypothetical protein